MKLNFALYFSVLFAMFPLTGCGGLSSEYIPPSIILPPHIKSIAVKPFENQTQQSAIGNKLWLATTDEFIRDGRIAYTDDQNKADGIVEGIITQYRETELSHDANLVPLEYQVWIVMNLKFLDKHNNQYLWEEPLLEQKLRYFTETQPGGKTVEEAREELWDRFSVDIVRRTVEGFGVVTGASPKAVPKDQTPDNPVPVYQSPAPY
ncbi:MAG: hypothetical protein KCHDKBKB_00516 [Elusimicrobia bacterium]|nr:hypothetical protein [Elusimicrobiota bacterium]